MTSSTSTAAPTSTLADQSITVALTAEIMTDPDTGQPTFCVAADPTFGDFREVTSAAAVYAATNAVRASLNPIDRLATQFFQAQAADTKPRTWTVANSVTGLPIHVTCMRGCIGFHPEEASGAGLPADISCVQYDQANTTELQIGCGAEHFGEVSTLSVEIKSNPVHPDPAKREPLAAIEVMEDHYIEDLDPDELAVVIDRLDQRVAAMRIRHAELVRIRAEYSRQQT